MHECPYVDRAAVLKWLSDGKFKEGDLVIFHKWMSRPFREGPAGAWDSYQKHTADVEARVFPTPELWDTVAFRIDTIKDHYWEWSE